MLRRSKSFIVSILFFSFSLSSLAQQVPEKYIVFIFEDVRNYSDYRKKDLCFREVFFWIADCDSFQKAHSISPLYIPYDDNAITTDTDGGRWLSNLLILNGSSPKDLLSSGSPFVQWINKQRKTKLQSIKIANAPNKRSSLKRKKETVNIYYVPVKGCFNKGKMYVKGDGWVKMYYPESIDGFEVAVLSDSEIELLHFLDCSAFDFSLYTYNNEAFQKGFCLLRESSQ